MMYLNGRANSHHFPLMGEWVERRLLFDGGGVRVGDKRSSACLLTHNPAANPQWLPLWKTGASRMCPSQDLWQPAQITLWQISTKRDSSRDRPWTQCACEQKGGEGYLFELLWSLSVFHINIAHSKRSLSVCSIEMGAGFMMVFS